MPDAFDPFNDRLARDIRNSLSVSFVAALACGDSDTLAAVGGHWLGLDLPTACRAYVVDRRRRYQAAKDEIQRRGLAGELEKAVVLWNQHLFFEVHELLEGIWRPAAGGRRDALKGLIQAAGVFVHLACNNRRAACRLALRARDLLQNHGRHLAIIANLEDLVNALNSQDPVPPVLVASDDGDNGLM